jgi:anti-sigma factor RsiW
MNHDYIIESNLIDQYVLGTLAADQVEEFEAHFVDCPECVDQLNISRSFIHDLKGLAAQETLFSDHEGAPRTRRWQLQQLVSLRFWPVIACGCLIVAVGVAFFAVRRLGRLEAELRQAKEDAAAISQKYQQGLEAAAESEKRHNETNQELVQRLDEIEQKLKTGGAANRREQSSVRGSEAPEVNFPIYALVSLARGQVPAPVEIAPPASGSRFALSIPVEDRKDFSAYRVIILDHRGVTVFNQGGFKPDAYHTLSLSLNSKFLIPGTYDLRVEGLTPPNKWNTVGSYPFLIARRR